MVPSDWAMAGRAVEMMDPSKISMKGPQDITSGTIALRGRENGIRDPRIGAS